MPTRLFVSTNPSNPSPKPAEAKALAGEDERKKVRAGRKKFPHTTEKVSAHYGKKRKKGRKNTEKS